MLSISMMKGVVELKDLTLSPSALKQLNLPITIAWYALYARAGPAILARRARIRRSPCRLAASRDHHCTRESRPLTKSRKD